ncbi:endonuclease/exonuclease/phosphatase family protein [Glutamicibacter arilaitensis]|uniref:endonuclease/exonuclease/phosphatase family protein n=1 Tax=Glutamicibacter arilaitensis TaxID=256701 RepID=UPI003A8D1EAE
MLLAFPVLALITGVLRRRWIACGFVVVFLLCGLLPNLQLAAAAVQKDRADFELSVLSFNALKAGADPAQLAALIQAEDPQVLVLVETSEPLHQELATRGALDGLGYRSLEAPAGGQRDTVIFSKYPLNERTAELDTKTTGWYSLPVVDVKSPGGTFTVAGIHIYPPVGTAQRWRNGLQAVASWAAQQPDRPLVLAGDFNSVRAHPGFRSLKSDGFSEADGIFPASTWPADRKFNSMIGLDHIMARGASVTEFSVHAVDGSDHLAVSATVAFDH